MAGSAKFELREPEFELREPESGLREPEFRFREAELRKAGFKLNNPDDILDEIASSKGTSGMGVYEVIKKLEPKPEVLKPGAAWTPEKIEETFAGTGVGRKTIGQIIKDHGLDHKTAHQRLKESGIKAKDDDKIKELADKHDSTPIKILTIILVDKS